MLGSDKVRSLIDAETDQTRKKALELAYTCYPLLNEATIDQLIEFQEVMSATAQSAKERTAAAGLKLLLERAKDQAEIIKRG